MVRWSLRRSWLNFHRIRRHQSIGCDLNLKQNKQFTLIINQKNNFMKANKLFLLAMGLVAVGCNDSQIEEQSLINDAQGELVEVVIDATVAPASRATSDVEYVEGSDDRNSFIELDFEVGDDIGVYFNFENEAVNFGMTHENVKFTAVEKTETGVRYTTEEQLMLLANGNNVYAYYPYAKTETGFEGSVTRSSNLGNWDGYHYFEIEDVQEMAGIKDYSNLSSYVKLVSREQKITKVGNKATVNMAFEHAFSYVTLHLTNTLEKEVNIKEAVIKFYNGSEPIAIVGDLASGLGVAVQGESIPTSIENGKPEVKVVPAEGAELVLEAGDKTMITAAIAPIAAWDKCVWTIRTVDGYTYTDAFELNTPRAIRQSKNQALNIALSDETLGSEVSSDEAAEGILDKNLEHIVLDLTKDTTLELKAWDSAAWGGENTKTITINGNGHTLTFNNTNSDWNNIVAGNAKLIFNNVHLTNTGYNDGPWNRHDLVFACEVEMHHVTTDKAIALENSATLKDVIISDVHPDNSDVYAIWISPRTEGQKVRLDEVTILAHESKTGDRGIKIDNQYVEDEKVVTLDISNITFNTQKKAAILVKTEVGAVINIGENVNIEGVAADSENHVWIDSDAAAYAKSVTVTGGNWKIEDATWSVKADGTAVAEDQAGLGGALAFGINTVEIADGAYTLPSVSDRIIEISGSRAAEITIGSPNFSGSQLTLKGVTVIGSGYSTGVQHVITVSYVNALIKGEMCLYGVGVTFDYCDFELGTDQYIWVYGAKTAYFRNCTFDTKGKAILIYNEGAGANNVTVKNCRFNSTGAGYVGAAPMNAQSCAAIEIDNSQTSGVGVAHKLTTEKNSYSASFSGEWRIKKYVEGAPVTVNGKEYTQIALDGKLMEVNDGVLDFVQE